MSKQKFSKKEELSRALKMLKSGKLEDAFWSGLIKTIDGCTVEPDGTCPHGYTSPLVLVGMS